LGKTYPNHVDKIKIKFFTTDFELWYLPHAFPQTKHLLAMAAVFIEKSVIMPV
jgi:hypothetical protein